jgi:hypothetical protein
MMAESSHINQRGDERRVSRGQYNDRQGCCRRTGCCGFDHYNYASKEEGLTAESSDHIRERPGCSFELPPVAQTTTNEMASGFAVDR